ncbi:NADP-dependent oxidoreductase [Arthrobacter sp. KR32]|uniref:NADP-dependent oxidoreductase n=2 Tax=Arthrobacter bussei TaxID=2594179 RepID=A0A7X1NMT0_9MICC|nr:NADP-dependent oxidoreductase [Arthrobacter bussei]
MRALVLDGFGDEDAFSLREVPMPVAGPGEVRIRVHAIGINPLETKIRRGWMAEVMPITFPAVIGSELAGVVDSVGDGVAGFEVGDRVAGFAATGSYAEYALSRVDAVALVPANLSLEDAVTIPTGAETTRRAIAPLRIAAGETVVVNGAAGGVGSMAVQLLVADGVTVIGTAGEANHEYLRSLGAVPVAYGDGVVERIRAAAPQGVDAVFDVAGQGFIPAAIELVGGPDRIITISDFTAPGLGVAVAAGDPTRLTADGFADALDLAAQGVLSTPIAATFAFAALPDAHRLSEGGHLRGKIVVQGL